MHYGCSLGNFRDIRPLPEPDEGTPLHTIKVNIRDQQKRFNQLLEAMTRQEQVEGCYVMDYSEFKEQGELYAKFTLHKDKPPLLDL